MVKIESVAAEIFLILTDVTGTNVAWTNVTRTLLSNDADAPINPPSKYGLVVISSMG